MDRHILYTFMHARTDTQHFYVPPYEFAMASKAMMGCMTGSNCAYIGAENPK